MEIEHVSPLDEAAKSRFQEVLGQIPTPEAERLKDLIKQGVVRVMAGESIRALQKKLGVVGFNACFDPNTNSAKAIVGVDTQIFFQKVH